MGKGVVKKAAVAAIGILFFLAMSAAPSYVASAEGQSGVTTAEDSSQVQPSLVIGELEYYDPAVFSDDDAIRLCQSFGAPWKDPDERPNSLSASTAEGQLLLACLHAESTNLLKLLSGSSGIFDGNLKVISYCEKALALRPGYAESYVVMAEAQLELDKFAEAEASVRSAISLEPGWASSYCTLSNVLWMQGRYIEALEASQQEDRLRSEAVLGDASSGYKGPESWHSAECDEVRANRLEFELEQN